MVQYIITPWKYHHELLQVRDEIYQRGKYTAPIDKRQHAVDWIRAWHLRGNLPHAIDSTANLVDAILHHDATKNSIFSIKATYAAAFSRFVTGYCDIEQNVKFKRSMFDVAKEIGMPVTFVELRHECTHDEMPTLPVLTRYAELALAWIWDHYWMGLEEGEEQTGQKPQEAPKVIKPIRGPLPRKRLREVLETFLAVRKSEIKSGSADMSQQSASGVAGLELVRICLEDEALLSDLCQILIEVKMMIPANREIDDNMQGAWLIWGNLLRRLTLHQGSFISTLTTLIVARMTQGSAQHIQFDAAIEALYLWLAHIFEDELWRNAEIAAKVDDTRQGVMNECMMNPNHWTSLLAQRLIVSGNEEFIEQWKAFLED